MTGEEMRAVLLDIVRQRADSHTLQAGAVIGEAAERLGIRNDLRQEQALLTFWSDLFRTGYLAWGYNLSNIDPPFCHITEQGRRALANFSRDPANPAGYMSYLDSRVTLNPISASYVKEALATYNAGQFKAAAVMVGAAAEATVLALRDALRDKLQATGGSKIPDLDDWRIKRVLGAIESFFVARGNDLPRPLLEAFEAYWSAFTHQIRLARNDAGHPSSIEPITPDTVQASMLIFPELAALARGLQSWVDQHL